MTMSGRIDYLPKVVAEHVPFALGFFAIIANVHSSHHLGRKFFPLCKSRNASRFSLVISSSVIKRGAGEKPARPL